MDEETLSRLLAELQASKAEDFPSEEETIGRQKSTRERFAPNAAKTAVRNP
ncbi:hypothetical protein [Paenibacillus elgii]|uniref:hypothetical protein n=1 Tax=Paenibacillus elgii TaxID=189691 RepID=UPI0013D39E8B|nr:hypothetical protein [Paenibacillus elgii]